jgi:ribosomal protein S18 acetylase RimI-like enzyme
MSDSRADAIRIERLDRSTASANSNRIAELLNRIPLLDYAADDVVAEVSHRGKPYGHKWHHSLFANADNEIVAVLIAYEKQVDPPYYPERSSYLSEIAVDPAWEGLGIARRLTEQWLDETSDIGPHSLQTNSSESNATVIAFYERLGFRKVSEKTYDNRVDLIMYRTQEV